MEHYRLDHSDETCLDECNCGAEPSTLYLSGKYLTSCPKCKESTQFQPTYIDAMIKWNKTQRAIV